MSVQTLLEELLLRLAVADGFITDDGALSDPISQLIVDRRPGEEVTLNGHPLHHLLGLPERSLREMGTTPGEVATALRVAGLATPIEPLDGSPRERALTALVVALACHVLGERREGAQRPARTLPPIDTTQDEQAHRVRDERLLEQFTQDIKLTRANADRFMEEARKERHPARAEEKRQRAAAMQAEAEEMERRIGNARSRLSPVPDEAA